jgi:hypothetical protein
MMTTTMMTNNDNYDNNNNNYYYNYNNDNNNKYFSWVLPLQRAPATAVYGSRCIDSWHMASLCSYGWCFLFFTIPFFLFFSFGFFFFGFFFCKQTPLLFPPTDLCLPTGRRAAEHKVLSYLHVDSCHLTWSPWLISF